MNNINDDRDLAVFLCGAPGIATLGSAVAEGLQRVVAGKVQVLGPGVGVVAVDVHVLDGAVSEDQLGAVLSVVAVLAVGVAHGVDVGVK